MIRYLGFLAAALFIAARAHAAPLDYLPGLAGDYFKLESEKVARPFHIHVRLPEKYEESEGPYPVVYLLDGDVLFPILGAYHLLLHYDEPVPDAIVVGISYGTFDRNNGNYRAVDYSTPPLDDGNPQGGAFAFQAFLADELIPAVEARFKADPSKRILVGQSRGAHFVLYSALTRPDLFWGRIASNPSLHPHKEFFFRDLSAIEPADSNLYFSRGSRDWENLRADTIELFEHFDAAGSTPWRLKTATMSGETHAAGIVNVYRDAMLWLFGSEENARD